jgi:hypothetical protein
VVYGHHHLNVTNIEEQKRFFVNALGGTAIKVGTNNIEIVKFPNVFVHRVDGGPGQDSVTTRRLQANASSTHLGMKPSHASIHSHEVVVGDVGQLNLVRC